MKRLIKSLSPLERKVLSVLKDSKTLEEIEAGSNLKQVEVLRALQWLENKNLVKINTELKEIILLDKNGLKYAKDKLPERKFLEVLGNKELTLKEIKEKADLNYEEENVCIGILKSKAALETIKGKDVKFKLNSNGLKLLEKETPEERLIHKLSKGIKETKTLDEEEKFALNNLKKRREIVKVDVVKARIIDLTKKGIEILKGNLELDLIEKL